MKKSLLLLIALFLGMAAFNACKKTEDVNDKDVITAEDLSVNEDFSEQTDLDVDVAIEERGDRFGTLTTANGNSFTIRLRR